MEDDDEKNRKIIAMFGGIKAFRHFFRNNKTMVIEVKKNMEQVIVMFSENKITLFMLDDGALHTLCLLFYRKKYY